MATCIRCGTDLPVDSKSCPACGDGQEEDAPRGTWSGIGEGIQLAEGEEPPSSTAAGLSPLALRPGATAGPPALPGARGRRSPADLTPLPASSLAIAQHPQLNRPEETRARRREAEVVSLHRAPPAASTEAAPAAGAAASEEPSPAPRKDAISSERRRAVNPTPPSKEKGNGKEEVEAPAAPLLASELLREHLDPTEPAGRTVRTLGVASGLAGAVLAALAGGLGPFALVTSGLLLSMAIVAAVRISYPNRAAGLLTLGLVGMGFADWPRLRAGAGPEELLLSLATLFLAGFLLLRAYHRASRLARTGVVVSVLAMLLWLVLTLPEAGLGLASGDWEATMIALFRFDLLIFVFLSMLAFLPSTSRGGCHIWAYGLVGLYASRAGYLVLSLDLPDPMASALIIGGCSVLIGAMSLAQVLATIRTRGLKG